MKVIKENDGYVTCFELYGFLLKELEKLSDERVQLNGDEHRCRYAYLNVVQYIEANSIVCAEDVENADQGDGLNVLMLYGLGVSCRKNAVARAQLNATLHELFSSYRLSPQELLQICDLAPTLLVDLYALISSCGDRFDEQSLKSMLALCQHAFIQTMKNELEYRITITVLCVKDNRLPPTQTEYFVTFRWKDESFRLQNIPSNHYGSADTIELVVDPMDHVESSIAFDVFSKTPTSYEYCGRSVVLIKEFMKWCKGKYRSRYFFLNDNVHSRERKKSGPAWVYASFICVASPIHGVIDLREIKKIGAVEIRCPPKKKYVKDKKISHIKRYINDVGFARMCNIVRSIAPLNCDALNDLKYTEVKRMRRALIIGITYENTKFQLESSKTDAKKIHEALIEVYKWPNTPDTMRILIENSPPHMYPSKDNISESLKWLVEGAKEGDALFLYFSGHGASADDNDGIEGDGRNEGFLPADHQDKGYTFDDFLHKIIVNPLPHLVRLTAIFDCCLSGTVLDLPFIYKKGKWEADVNPYLVISDIQLLSAAGDAQLAFENSEDGRFTNGILECIERNPDISFVELLEKSQGCKHCATGNRCQMQMCSDLGENQTAQLTASQMFMQDRPFRFSNILSNQNSIIKQILWDVRDRGAPLTIDTHIDEDGGKDDLDDLFMFYYNDDMSDYSDYSV